MLDEVTMKPQQYFKTKEAMLKGMGLEVSGSRF